jgi:hypothetical protein
MANVVVLDGSPTTVPTLDAGEIIDEQIAYPDVLHVKGRCRCAVAPRHPGCRVVAILRESD